MKLPTLKALGTTAGAGVQERIVGGTDACSGDSGGPLFTAAKDDTLRLSGITSWGDGCTIADQPGIYNQMRTTSAPEQSSSQLDIAQIGIVGGRSNSSEAGSLCIAIMPILMLLLCLRFKPFVLLRN